jgi:hypothetical protein
MNKQRSFPLLLALFSGILILVSSCADNGLGQRVKEPFSASKYESNSRYYRSVGKGVSSRDDVARSKAELDARAGLAQQVKTNIQAVTDDYQQETSGQHVDEAVARFETLVREITNVTIADLRMIGTEKYLSEDGKYTVYVAFEIKKAAMYRTMKKLARADERLSKAALSEMEAILDAQISTAESAE